MMTPQAAFLADIIRDPHDDTTRLVYADWLDEHGDPTRAKFIRLQIQEWKETQGKWGPSSVWKPIADLFWANRDRWVKNELPAWVHNEGEIEFRRGFAAGVSTTALRLVRKAEELWQFAPIEKLVLRGARGKMVALADCPFLTRVTELQMEDGIGDAEVVAIVSSSYIGQMTKLDLSNNQVGDVGARALAGCARLANLATLDLHGFQCQIGDAGALALARSPYLKNLERLDLFCPRISSAARKTIKKHLGKRVTI
jgi:uncharacterized protein (TIGR02996 family)